MKTAKKLIALLIACIFVVGSLAACGGGGSNGGGSGAADGGSKGADKSEIVIGYVSSFTGALAEFTQAFDWDSKLCLDAINKDGGIEINGKKYPVRVVTGDTESNATTASEVAKKLILEDKADVLMVAWTPENVAPASIVAEQYGVPCICVNTPYESWTATYDPDWAYGLMFSVDDIIASYVSALDKIKDETNGTVGFLFDSDVDGVTFSTKLQPVLEQHGFTVYDPGRFSVDTTDYTSIIADFQAKGCDIICGNQILPNFMTAWKQFNEKNYIPKAFVVGKALCYGTDFMALDPLPDGILSEVHFSRDLPYKSDLLGLTVQELADKWESEQGTQFPEASFGYDISGWEVLNEALKNCKDLEPETIKAAIGAVDMDTIFGHISFTEANGHVAKCPVVCGQWYPSEKWDATYDFNIVGTGNFTDIASEDPYVIPNTTQK